jgi:hypothetical protein
MMRENLAYPEIVRSPMPTKQTHAVEPFSDGFPVFCPSAVSELFAMSSCPLKSRVKGKEPL